MEFMELLLLLFIAFVIFKKPEKEAVAFKMLIGVFVLIAVVFYAIDIQYMVLPPLNL